MSRPQPFPWQPPSQFGKRSFLEPKAPPLSQLLPRHRPSHAAAATFTVDVIVVVVAATIAASQNLHFFLSKVCLTLVYIDRHLSSNLRPHSFPQAPDPPPIPPASASRFHFPFSPPPRPHPSNSFARLLFLLQQSVCRSTTTGS